MNWNNTMRYTLQELAGMIDHALLSPTMTDREMEAGCAVALRYQVASVCIKPYAVPLAARLLAGSHVAVCTVIGFPHGSSATESKRYETEIACKEGATEVDMVINIGKTLSEDWEYVRRDIAAVADEAHRHKALVKVIFETDYITQDTLKIRLCHICAEAGVEFVKTSTGFGFVKGADGKYDYEGATEANLRLLRAYSPSAVGVKASGSIRDLDTLILCRDLGCARVGASGTAAMLDEYERRVAASAQGQQSEDKENGSAAQLGTGGY